MRIISASIDLNKIDKTLIVPGKDGAKYYNLDIIVSDTKNTYGQDVSISDKQTKEQREAKAKKKFIGNGKTVWSSEPTPETAQVIDETKKESNSNAGDDLPF
jgi:outer membrane lipoprotein-sorting protein